MLMYQPYFFNQIAQEETSKRQEAERRVVAEQIEAERRATEKYKSDLESKVQRERALAEAEGRIRENRENEDVNRRCACGWSRVWLQWPGRSRPQGAAAWAMHVASG